MGYLIREVFQSLQGEGPALGASATFIRFAGCNLTCSYCDTDHRSGTELSLADLLSRVETGPSRVVITGGEPLLAGEPLVDLAAAISGTGRSVDIETNGTIAPPRQLAGFVDNYVISPKLSNSGNPLAERCLADRLPPGPLKFVVDGIADLQEVSDIVLTMPHREVIIMPMGTDPVAMVRQMKLLSQPVAAHGWRLLPRLHILLGIR
ncbi:MAG: 7-carboxy-7-deazaguanine synthase QueE [Thermoleophilia bacterium]